ncbi:MAG: threonine dehydratase [Verrucomicrobia bacterium]|nr:threonine dehydratase [Verrucomicrobiota bacterium]
MFTPAEFQEASALVYRTLSPTAQIHWPLLSQRAGCEVWVKHENHHPTGAFKVRGGLVYLDHLKRTRSGLRGVITATTGNHGQSIAFAGARLGIPVTICVPFGNSVEKNAAMRGYGAELIEVGHDFQSAREAATQLAAERSLEVVPSFHPLLVRGVATCAHELFTARPELDTVYCPIGLGSGVCGLVTMRDQLGLRTRVVGVVAAGAPAYAKSFAAGRVLASDEVNTMAEGVAVRMPDADALAVIRRGVERIVEITEPEIEAAIRAYFTDTHNVAEGAGALALAALLNDPPAQRGKRVGVILSGGNIDRPRFAKILAG